MDTILPYALLCFTSFFTLTNPLGTMPVFLTMTNGLEEKERQHIVKRATIISFIILIAFTFCGQFLFKFFGISTNGFRIAAGIIILKIGYDMLQARYTNTKLKDEEIKLMQMIFQSHHFYSDAVWTGRYCQWHYHDG